jgi:hypothetical protein
MGSGNAVPCRGNGIASQLLSSSFHRFSIHLPSHFIGVIAHSIDLPSLGSLMPSLVMPMPRDCWPMFFGDACGSWHFALPPEAKAVRNMPINAESLPGYQI